MVNAPRTWISALEAAELLSVQRATLYAYVSRGLVRARHENGRRVYARSDLERLRARSEARRGHAAVAGAALRFGEPVLDTSVSSVDLDGPRYRGHSLLELARSHTSPERVAELLWTGSLENVTRWPSGDGALLERAARSLSTRATPLARMWLVAACAEPRAVRFFEAPSAAALAEARLLVRSLAVAPALAHGKKAVQAALSARTLAGSLLASFGRRASAKAERALAQALVLCADHELNASAFAARVAAGAGADLARCLLAALATLSGSRHGGTCDRLEAVVHAFAEPERALGWVQVEIAEGRPLPGFGHRLYPNGDPRAPPLLSLAVELGEKRRALRSVRALVDAARLAQDERPTLDLGLVALAAALDLPAGAASAIFSLGRSLGYVAHVFEQFEQGQLLRPRARYVGA